MSAIHSRTPPSSTSADGEPKDAERARIEAVYGEYRDSERDIQRWDDDAPGNRCILSERVAIARRLLDPLKPPTTTLEVGCGQGTVMRELQARVLRTDADVFGVDLLAERLPTARRPNTHPVQADGRELPFRDAQFDLVVTYTVFSSILDNGLRRVLAREIDRVLTPEGSLLWYDLRIPSPNRSVRPLGRSSVRDLFPGREHTFVSATVLPPLARALGNKDHLVYPTLARLPFLRSHLVGLIGPKHRQGSGG